MEVSNHSPLDTFDLPPLNLQDQAQLAYYRQSQLTCILLLHKSHRHNQTPFPHLHHHFIKANDKNQGHQYALFIHYQSLKCPLKKDCSYTLNKHHLSLVNLSISLHIKEYLMYDQLSSFQD